MELHVEGGLRHYLLEYSNVQAMGKQCRCTFNILKIVDIDNVKQFGTILSILIFRSIHELGDQLAQLHRMTKEIITILKNEWHVLKPQLIFE